jgi:hypothetical protein
MKKITKDESDTNPNVKSLNKASVSTINALDSRLKDIVLGLGQLQIQYDLNREQLSSQYRQTQQEYSAAVIKAATALGIETDPNLTEERWQYDPTTQTFVRTLSPDTQS